MVRDLAREVDIEAVVETGTYRGTSTEFLAHVFGVPVWTVEAHPRYYEYARRRLAACADVQIEQGDSREFLRRIPAPASDSSAATLFYLDAHWAEDLPLREELQIIEGKWPAAVIIIDDFEVPDDAGYAFDDYGPGKCLTESYLPPLNGWTIRYPASPSHEESGARRGCVVLGSPVMRAAVEKLASLRAAESSSPNVG